MVECLAPETAICILVYELEKTLEGFYFRSGSITVPLHVRSFPEHLPYIAAFHVAALRDGLLDLLRGIGKQRSDQEKLDIVAFYPLPFPDLISQMQRRPAPGPDQFPNQASVT